MEWNGTGVSRMEWTGAGVSRMEWTGLEWTGMEWNGMDPVLAEWNGMKHGPGVSRSRVQEPAISPSESRSDEYRSGRD